LLVGCNQLRATAEGPPEPSAQAASSSAPAAASAGAQRGPEVAGEGAEAGKNQRFALPFAWEVSKDEPLAKARGFISELLADNARQAALGKQHFAALAEGQHPRATVVACADARVQAQAWDASAEGDDYTVRNLGNSVENSVGSVEYGVARLHTPVLLILGHTGCDAVKAVLDHGPDLGPVVAKELANVKPGDVGGASKSKAWARAVENNVNAQVDVALSHFAAIVHRGELTVVGAVYDLGNEMGKGVGRVNIVNVNANTEPERIKAFVKAVEEAGATPLTGQPAPGAVVPEVALEATRQALRALPEPSATPHED
jgi:carbonic anhydrase